jgi:hypothetical protein
MNGPTSAGTTLTVSGFNMGFSDPTPSLMLTSTSCVSSSWTSVTQVTCASSASTTEGNGRAQFGYALNQREVSLRGYRGTETALRGQNMRVSSIEWRTPIADVDWHGMAPPIGLNRLSGTAFVDAGGAWNPGASGPLRVRHGVGVEVLGELRLLYLQQVQLRLGVARGLDAPKGTVGYLSVGRAF